MVSDSDYLITNVCCMLACITTFKVMSITCTGHGPLVMNKQQRHEIFVICWVIPSNYKPAIALGGNHHYACVYRYLNKTSVSESVCCLFSHFQLKAGDFST